MKGLRRFSAVLLGFVLFIAGILKLMDPVGAGLVMHEYFKFLHLTFLYGISYASGTTAALVETILGAAMITGVQRKFTAYAGLVVLGGFTILTLLILIFNPSMDCGCFGEAIKLTHAQTFIKNIFLMALWGLAFLPVNNQEPTRKVRYVSFALTSASVILFTIYSANSVPLVDFTDFKPGTELMSSDEYDIPEDASTLMFSNMDGEYADSLALGGKVIIASVYDPSKVKEATWERIAVTLGNAHEAGFRTLLLAASTPSDMMLFVREPELMENVFYADRKVLMTLNRSNGGCSYISDGLIIAKWSKNNMPDSEKLDELLKSDMTESLISENNSSRLKLQAFLLYVFAIMLLL